MGSPVIGIAALGLIAVVVGIFIVAKRREKGAVERMRTADGTIEGGYAQEVPGGGVFNAMGWHAMVSYSFTVDDKFYSGSYRSKRFFSQAEAEAYVDWLPKGAEVVVRYQADNPEISIVREEDQPRQGGAPAGA